MGFQNVNDTINTAEDYSKGYYLGTVTLNADSTGLGRVQAHIPGTFDTNAGEVPMIGRIPSSPYAFGIGPNGPYGVYGTPPVGALVKVEFQNGDQNKGLWECFASEGMIPDAFKDPNTWGWRDPAGNQQYVNMSTGAFEWTHTSGASVKWDGSGNVIEVVPGNATWNVNGNATMHVTGNFSLDVGGTATYKASVHQFQGPIVADSSISAGGDITDLTASGNTKTVGNMRVVYDSHTHIYFNDGGEQHTSIPEQQI